MGGKSHRQMPAFMASPQPQLPAQVLYEQVLALWHGGKHDTRSIALQLSVDEAEVCRIIQECEGRANG